MLEIEKRIYNELKPNLVIDEFDRAFYWMEEDHLGEKNFEDKMNDFYNGITGIPLTDEQYVPDDEYTKRASPTYKNVITWMKKTPKVTESIT